MAAKIDSKKPKSYLGKQNRKYAHVKPVVNTGASISHYHEKIEEIRKNYRFKKDEIFKRMKVSTFAQLVLQVAEVVNMEMEKIQIGQTDRSDNSNADYSSSDDEDVATERCNPPSERAVLIDLVRGFGELDPNENESDEKKEDTEEEETVVPEATSLPFLLLDIRDSDAFEECHIIGALNYPSAMLNRTVSYLSKEMLIFKNKPGKIIIVYDDDEKLAPQVATTLVQKEIDNVVMLSGGMKVLHKKFPGCFLTGTVPSSCFSPKTDRKGRLKPTPKVTDNESMEWYNSGLLAKIQEYLDDVLLSNQSSRLSTRTTTRASEASGRSSTSTLRSGR